MVTYSLELFEQYLSPFSGHMLEFKGVLYPTIEHAYHCQRYADPQVVAAIRNTRSAWSAWELSQLHKKEQIPDWDSQKTEVMEELFRAALDQHVDIRKALIESGNSLILHHNANDSFWGDGADGAGRNEMGKIWMKLRAELQSATS
jgi:N-glycosidase YbiA